MKCSDTISRAPQEVYLIATTDNQDVEIYVQNDCQQVLEKYFNDAMGECASFISNWHSDIDLLSIFIAKMRWDVYI